MFKNVKKAHLEKLELVLKRPKEWYVAMINELLNPKYRGKFIRIHDSGDFFNEDYALRWIKLATRFPSITFYTYTKEVSMFKRLSVPLNFIVIYSLGGREDHLIDIKKDRHSDVFPDEAAMIAAGYNDIKDDDKQAAIHPNHKVGLYRNNIPHLVKKQGSKTFSEWQTKNSKDGIKETGND
jgi:hypothetical protein